MRFGRLGNVFGPLLGGVLLGYGLPPRYIFLCAVIPVTITVISMFLLGTIRSGRAREARVSGMVAT